MGRSVFLAAYMLLSRFGEGWFARKLNGANPERKAIASAPRPDGPLIWVNVTSVSGADGVLTLMRRLLDQNPSLNCLVTTKEETVAKSIQHRLHPRMIHQYIPVDAKAYVNTFLDHWKPDLSVWTETEFQPAFVVQANQRGIPTIYIDALLSAKSYSQYRLFNGMTASLLKRFDHILTQDMPSKKYLQSLGTSADKIEISGRLSGNALPMPYDENQRKALARAIGGRAVWLAALTFECEEEAIIAAHQEARRSFPELLLIIAPYQSDRGDAIAAMIRGHDCTVAQRSNSQQIDRQTDIYIADIPNEMGLWYRLAPVTFLGGSLTDHGGQNPLPVAALGSAILHGPHISNFTDAYETLLNADACIQVADGKTLASKLESVLAPERAAQLATAAWGAYGDDESANDRAFDLLQSYFPKEVY